MLSDNDSTFPYGDSHGRSSTGIRGPYPIPVDDDELEVDVADSTIAELEDGFSFYLRTPPPTEDPTGHDDAVVEATALTMRESLDRNWLVEHGES
jgi:hypothetical protein